MLMAGCATAPSYNPRHLTPTRLGEIQEICRYVIGSSPSEPADPPWDSDSSVNPFLGPVINHYQACIASLSDTVLAAKRAAALARAETRCQAEVASPSRRGLSTCVVRSLPDDPAKAAPADALTRAASVTPAIPPKKPWVAASPVEASRRAELACAHLGLDPAFGLFDSCVTHLRTSMNLQTLPFY